MLTIEDFHNKARQCKFQEYPFSTYDSGPNISSFIEYEKADLSLKIYLAELIICRSFSPLGILWFSADPRWFILNAMESFSKDLLKPWSTAAIKEAMAMIMSKEDFTKGIIGTTFMFGVIEFYAKHMLGWRPNEFDFFDKENHKHYREISIGTAIGKLKKTQYPIARSLNKIDKYNQAKLNTRGIKEDRYTQAKISDRINLARNTMLHGESHSFYIEGQYLVMLYFLFYYHDLNKKIGKTH